MATISWERPGVRVVQGVGKSGIVESNRCYGVPPMS